MRRDLAQHAATRHLRPRLCQSALFRRRQGARLRPSLLKAQAHAFGPDDLELWIKVMHAMVSLRGTVTLIHRADSLGKILACHGRAALATFVLLRSMPAKARQRAASSCRASRVPRHRCNCCRALILHGEGNAFTPDAEAVSARRHGLAVALTYPAICTPDFASGMVDFNSSCLADMGFAK